MVSFISSLLCVVSVAMADSSSNPVIEVHFTDQEVPYFEATKNNELIFREAAQSLSHSGSSVLDSLRIPAIGFPAKGL